MINILNKNKFKKFPIISLLIVAMCGGSSTTVETSEAPPVEIDTEVEVDNDFNEENQNEDIFELVLDEKVTLTHDTNRYRFKLPNENDVLGLPVG